jgi:hypothetical protein
MSGRKTISRNKASNDMPFTPRLVFVTASSVKEARRA